MDAYVRFGTKFEGRIEIVPESATVAEGALDFIERGTKFLRPTHLPDVMACLSFGDRSFNR